MAFVCPCCKDPNINPATHTCGAKNAAIAAGNLIKIWSQKPKPLSGYNGTTQPLENATAVRPATITSDMVKKYNVVRQNWGNDIGGRIGGSQFDKFQKKYTVTDIYQYTGAEFLLLVNEIWKEIVEFQPYNTSVANMADPGAGNHSSSFTQPSQAVFNQTGICYRCDARKPSSVLGLGFLPAYNISPESHVKDTIMEHCTKGTAGITRSAGFWIGNRDIVNQTSICAARTLKGCGKFPEPQNKGFHYFYALKLPVTKLGFDTEARQQTTGGRWLPGEKAFASVSKDEVIAWTKIRKLGSDTGTIAFNFYQYQILENLWHFTSGATDADKTYLNAELNALTGGQGLTTITIKKSEDFVSGQ